MKSNGQHSSPYYRHRDSIDEDDYELENEHRPAHADKHLESDEYFNRYRYYDRFREQDSVGNSNTDKAASTGAAATALEDRLPHAAASDALLIQDGDGRRDKSRNDSLDYSYRTAPSLSSSHATDAEGRASEDTAGGDEPRGLFSGWW